MDVSYTPSVGEEKADPWARHTFGYSALLLVVMGISLNKSLSLSLSLFLPLSLPPFPSLSLPLLCLLVFKQMTVSFFVSIWPTTLEITSPGRGPTHFPCILPCVVTTQAAEVLKA